MDLITLITQRSQVQIPPPQPSQLAARGRPFLATSSHFGRRPQHRRQIPFQLDSGGLALVRRQDDGVDEARSASEASVRVSGCSRACASAVTFCAVQLRPCPGAAAAAARPRLRACASSSSRLAAFAFTRPSLPKARRRSSPSRSASCAEPRSARSRARLQTGWRGAPSGAGSSRG